MVDLKFTNAIGQIEAANVTPCGDCCVKYETDDGPGNLDNGTYTGPLGDQPCSDDAPEYAKIRDGILLTTGNCNGTFVADCGYIRTVRNYLGPTSSATRKVPKALSLLVVMTISLSLI
ncbi:hypothetical protein E3P81_02848 [Wallemia ichthyophaga]|uniref:Uncharacterized protein n=1 Tax=Wallemia ichthyophaga TaxID=245174 RepID=A0A4T0JAY1_WALIC|nr:hypothetical protein E3P97_02854 [Wallemia ichthyophaga]TIB29683.1 hypothetical protein E3P85_03081 [Wallemia ichthyophaga]TIB37381.1 hypothetical protein E3P86_02209 [Wallemia ichthyophaga]TIB45488.1 hypothetical protein E3P82_02783 [Wallemia ichthyophaga]TIB48649.1 hypothetical protein E3P81_02848 [Wallemia ichthyophaga]